MRKLKLWHWIVIVVLLTPIVAVVVLGLLPAPVEPILSREEAVVGAQAASSAATPLDIDFPAANTPANNPSTPEKEQLGYLLFFDPVLSTNDDISCASCHHPDLGFSDGRVLAMGAGGVGVGPDRSGGTISDRHAASLYNKVYEAAFFWDGRVETLEAQAELALTNATEMNANPTQVVADLQAIPEYQALFAAAFPDSDDPITFENVTFALAAFERTLLANNSPYDQYAQGDASALTPAQKRGLALFRSAATGCYNCHTAPTFTTNDFAVTGISEPNGNPAISNRDEVTGEPNDAHAFKIPGLRNIGLTAPYMHNGSLATLEDVLDFYMAGGGHATHPDLPGLTRFLGTFELSDQEKSDLIAFLYALTDESSTPEIPVEVPSGLEVVPTLENPLREVADSYNTGSTATEPRQPTTLRVAAGSSIQAVVDTAVPGDVIEIEYATYTEMVLVDVPNLIIRGIPNAAGQWPVMDGQNQFTDAFSITANNFTIEQFEIRNYTVNGVFAEGVTTIIMRDLFVADIGIYGVYPVKSTDVLIERVEATGIQDAGIYVGQSTDIIVRDSVAYGNVVGIEIENSINADVYNNHTYNNSCGIFVDLLPRMTSKTSQDTRVYNNLIEGNNLPNFARPDLAVALVPPGTGILVLGADDVTIYDNTIRDNDTVGIAVFSTTIGFDDVDVHPNPERIHTYNNTYENNGGNPATLVTNLGLYGADIIWDASNWDVRFDDNVSSAFPPALPSSSWPTFLRKAYWQVLNFVISQLL